MTDRHMAPLIVESAPRQEDIRFLDNALYEFNRTRTGIDDGKLFGIFLRDADGTVAGGADGWTWGGTCKVQHLFVPADMRGRGLGTRLMQAIEDEARARGCRHILLKTHSFQAPDFYRRLGFELIGKVDDYPSGHGSLTLIKRLATTSSR
jgi:GNAT superfamily N-acetyltransferase